jgi:YidC/Oxa1 family membrane protein insertase
MSLAFLFLLAPATSKASLYTACDSEPWTSDPVFAHFSEDVAAWAESSSAISSFSLTCDGSRLIFRAVAIPNMTLTYSPDLAVLAESRPFYGLASYYNNIQEVEVRSPQSNSSWRGWKGRFAAALLESDEGGISINQRQIELIADVNGRLIMQLGLINSTGQGSFDGVQSDAIRYTHLWDWLRWLCLILEKVLVAIQSATGLGWGFCIVLLCTLIKIVLIPVSIFILVQQRKVSSIQTALAQPLREIKSRYDGEEAHDRIMAAHKDQGVSSFYALKPMLGLFIQIPILVAVFNMLGELPLLSGQSFLWISDLGYPDAILALGDSSMTVPMFGNTINLLPMLMTVITLGSAMIYRNRVAPVAETTKQKRNLYFMAIAFFVLFYPFPSSMVLYWATANLLQLIQQLIAEN